MVYLILSIVCSTVNHLLFKAFKQWKIKLLCAIVINYVVCVIIGFGSTRLTSIGGYLWRQDWFGFAIFHGLLLIGSYYLIALTTKHVGVAVASLATRISVMLPIVTAFFLYGDILTVFKAVGIFGALTALYLSSSENGSGPSVKAGSSHYLPVALFIAFGSHLTLTKYVQEYYLNDVVYHGYVMISFASALFFGAGAMTWRVLIKKDKYHKRDFLAGILLGCVNYGSVYFLIRALSVEGWESSEIFPTISIAVVISSSVSAHLLFSEKIQGSKMAALIIGLISVIFINR
jgi:drug/metabolite transporter (DMT)-like permease